MTATRPADHRVANATFGSWIRSRFIEINTELEELYEANGNRNATTGGDHLKSELVDDGEALLDGLTDEAFDGDVLERFGLLGDVGYFMAACRRHELIEPAGRIELPNASAVALRLGASLGTAPRFLTAHMQSHNFAHDGIYRTFTAYEAERTFLDYNTRSAFAYTRAADALARILPMGVSHPAAHDLFVNAADALGDALQLNRELADELNVDRFFFNVRPYYKPHRVGRNEYRGANAGDFAAFNEIDTLLGLCSMSDTSYAQVVVEKFPYLFPAEQQRLQDTLGCPNLLDAFLQQLDASDQEWFGRNAAAYLAVVDAHGRAAAQHHDDLVEKFIRRPSTQIPPEHLEGITASGPPLDVLIRSLERLRDQRLAAPRQDIPTRHDDIAALRAAIESQ